MENRLPSDAAAAISALNQALERQTQVLEQMARSMQTLESLTRADHLEQPFAARKWDDELAWRAMFSTAMAKTKEDVEIWRSSLNTILIFVGLFLAVITGFQGPVIDALSPDPTNMVVQELQNLTSILITLASINGLQTPIDVLNPSQFQPERSTMILNFFWSCSIVSSLFAAFLALLGIRWLDERIRNPRELPKWMHRTIWHNKREILSQTNAIRFLHLLQPLVLLSMGLFLIGYLYQGYFTSQSDDDSGILYSSSAINSLLSLAMVAILSYTLVHVVVHPQSPFATPFTRWVRGQSLVAEFLGRRNKGNDDAAESSDLLINLILDTTEPDDLEKAAPTFKECISVLSRQIGHLEMDPEKFSQILPAVIRMLRSDTSVKSKLTIAEAMHPILGCYVAIFHERGDNYLFGMMKFTIGVEDYTHELMSLFLQLHDDARSRNEPYSSVYLAAYAWIYLLSDYRTEDFQLTYKDKKSAVLRQFHATCTPGSNPIEPMLLAFRQDIYLGKFFHMAIQERADELALTMGLRKEEAFETALLQHSPPDSLMWLLHFGERTVSRDRLFALADRLIEHVMQDSSQLQLVVRSTSDPAPDGLSISGSGLTFDAVLHILAKCLEVPYSIHDISPILQIATYVWRHDLRHFEDPYSNSSLQTINWGNPNLLKIVTQLEQLDFRSCMCPDAVSGFLSICESSSFPGEVREKAKAMRKYGFSLSDRLEDTTPPT